MTGKLRALVPPLTSAWALMGNQRFRRGLPLVDIEDDCVLGWKLGVVDNALAVTLLLNKEDDNTILKSLQLPAHPVFSAFQRAFENLTGEYSKLPAISPIFESLNIPQPESNDVNDVMAAHNAFVKGRLSEWIKPGKGLDRVVGNLFICVSGDVSMAMNMGLNAFRPN